MAEYIDRDKAYDAVNKRIAELRADKEFNIVKEVCISGVKKHIASIPPADVVERKKIDGAIEEMGKYSNAFTYMGKHDKANVVDNCIEILKRNIGESRSVF